MKWNRLSKKQYRLMSWWADENAGYNAVIADGSIRSGKTLCMVCSFVLWAMTNYDRQLFGICGKTIASLRRNVILPLVNGLSGICKITEHRADNRLTVEYAGRVNQFYLFGGKDESSYMLIQGITLAGVMFDEVALMPQSFVNQAMGRCSTAGAKTWFNCNPESPAHWFYTDWIGQPDKRNALYLHFTMQDNPSLPEERRRWYESQFDGVFYDRYIKGLWVKAEGLVYPMFDKSRTFDTLPAAQYRYFISIDYGTQNPFSAGLWAVDSFRRVAFRAREYYYGGRERKKQLTDEEYYAEVEKLAGNLPVEYLVIDPSAASFIATVRRHGRFSVRKAVNDVLDGIRVVSSMLKAGMVLIHSGCADSIREFGLYSWDADAKGDDKVLKENDHAMDDIRYFCYTILAREFRWGNWG